MRSTSRAADVIAAIVKARTKQLEYRLQANRHGGSLSGERLYRAGEVDALLADLREELQSQELAQQLQQEPNTQQGAEPADR